MKRSVKALLRNPQFALIEDAVGAISLFVLLFAGLGFSGAL